MNVTNFQSPPERRSDRTVIIGAGMAGLSAAISLASQGHEVLLLETQSAPGGKMRTLPSSIGGIDSGPTVFTMKYVFDELFALAGREFSTEMKLHQADILARHAWAVAGSANPLNNRANNKDGIFDLYASRERSRDAIGAFFSPADADGYDRFCRDAAAIFNNLKDTFIGAQRPSPLALGQRVGLLNLPALWQLQPFVSLMSKLKTYFPDPRLQQLFGRYATYVGSSPYQAPATLMLIAHVEQEGVWLIEGGMHALARKMADVAQSLGVEIRYNNAVTKLISRDGRISGVLTAQDEIIPAAQVLYCGDVSALTPEFLGHDEKAPITTVKPEKRSLSAITWSVEAETSGFPLHRHNVFFSSNYRAEFESIFQKRKVPDEPTVYVCAQDRDDNGNCNSKTERLLVLVNAPATGDTQSHTQEQIGQCQTNMKKMLSQCGLTATFRKMTITTPHHFNQLFPGSGGALYGQASHGWTASFARSGAKTKIPGLYLAGGSVHPGPGVPMATRSGMLAAQQIMRDRVLT